MPAVLIQIDGYDPVAGGAVTLRASSVDDERVCHLNSQVWWPTIATLPALRYDLFDGDFSGKITTPSTSFALAIEAWPDFARYMLADARVQIWTGEAGAAWASFVQRFDGRVQVQPSIKDGVASLSIAVDDRWLDQPLLATYAGTTGIEGAAGLKGKVKPLAIGNPQFVPGVMIDSVNNVLQLSSAGPMQAVDTAMERVARFSASLGNYASYAALIAASIPAGQWATCLDFGLVRHGAPPAGELSYHVKGDNGGTGGWVRKPGDIIRRIAEISGNLAKVDTTSTAALNSARPWNLSLYVAEQTTARDLIQRIAASVNAVAGVDWLGKLFVAPVEAPPAELVTNGIFDSSVTGWTSFNSAVVSVVGGRARIQTSAGGAYGPGIRQAVPVDIGKTYVVNAKTFGHAARSVWLGTSTSGTQVGSFAGQDVTDFTFTATATTLHITLIINTSGVGVQAEFDDISVHEATSLTLDAEGSHLPPVQSVEQLEMAPPFWRLAIGAVPTWNVHALSDIAFTALLVDRGRFDLAETYREGHWVDLADGSRWVYINATPSAGNAPPTSGTSNAWWDQMTPPLDVEDIPGTAALAGTIVSGDSNRLRFSMMEAETRGWKVSNSGGVTASAFTTNSFAGKRYVRIAGSFTGASQYNSIVSDGVATPDFRVPVTGGERLSVTALFAANLSNSAMGTRLVIYFYDASGALAAPGTVLFSGTGTLAAWTEREAFVDVPATAVWAALEYYADSNAVTSGTYELFLAEPMICGAGADQTVHPTFSPGPDTEPAADVTLIASGTAAFTFDYDSGGVSTQFPRNFQYTLSNLAGTITSGVTATYTVETGTFNGFTSASGPQSMSVSSGVATLTANSLGTGTARVKVALSYGGKAVPFYTDFDKYIAPAAINGGLLATASSFSGFNSTTPTAVTGAGLTGAIPTGKTSATIDVTLSIDPATAGGNGTWTANVRVYRTIGGTPTAIGAGAVSDGTQVTGGVVSDSGDFNFSVSDTGLSPGVTYTWHVYAWLSSGSRTHAVTTGQVTITA